MNHLILIMPPKSSFRYLPNNILYCDSQNSYLVIVFDGFSFFPLFIISSDLYAWFYVCEQKKIVPMINMDTVTVSLSRETEGSSLGLRTTRIEQNYSYAPES